MSIMAWLSKSDVLCSAATESDSRVCTTLVELSRHGLLSSAVVQATHVLKLFAGPKRLGLFGAMLLKKTIYQISCLLDELANSSAIGKKPLHNETKPEVPMTKLLYYPECGY